MSFVERRTDAADQSSMDNALPSWTPARLVWLRGKTDRESKTADASRRRASVCTSVASGFSRHMWNYCVDTPADWSRGVAVITSALHAAGRQFDPGRLHFANIFVYYCQSVEVSVALHRCMERHALLRRNSLWYKPPHTLGSCQTASRHEFVPMFVTS